MEWIKSEDLEYDKPKKGLLELLTTETKMETDFMNWFRMLSIKQVLGITLAICVIVLGIFHGVFIYEMNNILKNKKDAPGIISINPITNTVTITVKPEEFDDSPFGALGMGVLAVMAPALERELAAEFTKRAKENLDFYVYSVPFSVKFNISILGTFGSVSKELPPVTDKPVRID